MITIIRPVITEKSLKLVELENQYTFIVNNSSNKIEVKKAVEKKYNVSVNNVSILNNIGKKTIFGRKRIEGRKSDIKKAIVTLKKGDNISEFDIK